MPASVRRVRDVGAPEDARAGLHATTWLRVLVRRRRRPSRESGVNGHKGNMMVDASEERPSAAAGSRHSDTRLLELRGQREMRFFRRSACLSGIILVATASWLVLSLALGLRAGHFSLSTMIGYVLLGLSGATTTAFALHWAPLLLQEPKSELLRALLGEEMSIRSRKRFLNRLGYQCELRLKDRAQRFSLVVVALPTVDGATAEGKRTMTDLFASVAGMIRGNDVIGDSGTNEAWILLMGAGLADCSSVCGRIVDALRGDVPLLRDSAVPVLIGAGAFETDGRGIDEMFRAARRRAETRTIGELDAA
jgi:hypothetical protein